MVLMDNNRWKQQTFLDQTRVQLTDFPAPEATAADTAIIICHGMGQQVPFETLNGIAEALVTAAAENGQLEVVPKVALMKQGETYLPRAEIRLVKDGKQKNIHLYEVYWAPITEGQVNSRDVLTFLLEGGRQGIIPCIKGYFKRFLFGDWQDLPIKRWTLALILMTCVVLVSLVIHFLAFAFLALSWSLPFFGFGAFDGALVERAIANWNWVLIAGILAGAVMCIPGLIRKLSSTGPGQDYPSRAEKALLWLPLVATILAIVVPMFFSISVLFCGWPTPLTVSQTLVFQRGLTMFGLAAWAFALWHVRVVIIEYVGDVAAYISAHKLNKFWTIRERIQQVALSVTNTVYSQRYGNIIMVGHSLGSVVAYDALNAIIREEKINPPREDELKRTRANRTRALVTFGSPLDKTAFLFREHLGENGLGVREALASAVQPLIADFANWPGDWINIYSPADIISGNLDYYQLPAETKSIPPNARTVVNVVDYESSMPLLAHTQYWTNRRLRKVLFDLCF
jgi:hypothetical protein